MLEKEKSNASLTEEDKMCLFSGIQTVVMSVDIMFSPSCKEPLTDLFSVVNENRSLFPKECNVFCFPYESQVEMDRSMEQCVLHREEHVY